jgi:hypothetical protein
MSAPILATVVETPKPKRPRLWCWLREFAHRPGEYQLGTTEKGSDLVALLPGSDLVLIPGSDDEWDEPKVRAAARQFMDGATKSKAGHIPTDEEIDEMFVEFARVLGVLPEAPQ